MKRIPDRPRLGGAGAASPLALTACGGGGDPLPAAPATRGAAAPNDTIVVGSANFPESQLLAEIYAQALSRPRASRSSKQLDIGSREAYIPALKDGSIDLIPEYTGVLLQFIDKAADRDRRRTTVYTALQAGAAGQPDRAGQVGGRGQGRGRRHAGDRDQCNLKSIADLGRSAADLVFGGPPEFQTRPDGIPGIKKTYGCTFKEFQLAGRRAAR